MYIWASTDDGPNWNLLSMQKMTETTINGTRAWTYDVPITTEGTYTIHWEPTYNESSIWDDVISKNEISYNVSYESYYYNQTSKKWIKVDDDNNQTQNNTENDNENQNSEDITSVNNAKEM